MPSVRVLVSGLGSIGRRHVRNLRQLGVTDFVTSRSRRGLSQDDGSGIREFPTLDAALATEPDVALICVPTRYHVEVAQCVAAARCPFFLEKPISDSMTGVRELDRMVRENGIWTMVGFNLRFHPVLLKAQALIQAGSIGRLLHLRAEVGQYLPDWHPDEDYRQGYSAQRSMGGGVVLDLIHEMDYASWLAGPIRSVVCVADRVSTLAIDTEDVAEIVVRFENGGLGSVHMDYLERSPHQAFRLVGEHGTIVGDLLTNTLRVFEVATRSWRSIELPPFERNTMFIDEMRHLLDCVAGRATPRVDLAAAIPVHAATISALEACRRLRSDPFVSAPQ
jgi:predicted dehydrogenase